MPNNDFTATNLSTWDVVEDTPTDNYATLNPLASEDSSHLTLSEGNLRAELTNAGQATTSPATFPFPSSGKWYAEVYAEYMGTADPTRPKVGLTPNAYFGDYSVDSQLQGSGEYSYEKGGDKCSATSCSAYGSAWTTGDIIGVAYDATAGTLTFYKNNTSQGTAFSGVSGELFLAISGYATSSTTNTFVLNFGQDPTFAGNKSGGATSEFFYTPPSGFSALSTGNLATPTIAKPSEHFLPVIYTGASPSDKTVTGVGFQADLTWIKSRNQTYDHVLYDSVRTATEELYPNTTGVEVTDTNGLKSWNSDGFVVGSDGEVGDPTGTRISWNWKKSATAGFNIVGWTGDDDGFSGGTQAVAHGLGVAPEMVIAKNRTDEAGGNGNWIVYHKDTTSGDLLKLDTADGEFTPNSTLIGSIGSTNVSFGNDSLYYEYLNSDNSWGSGTADTYIGYFFASVESYSKVGSYTGNGSADGPFVYFGFRPSFLIVKRAGGSGHWYMYDSTRSPYNELDLSLKADSSGTETTYGSLDLLSNGFKWRMTDSARNGSGETYIYVAFAESPFKYAYAR